MDFGPYFYSGELWRFVRKSLFPVDLAPGRISLQMDLGVYWPSYLSGLYLQPDTKLKSGYKRLR